MCPRRGTIEADAVSLLRDGHPWLATMGEVHPSRLSPGEWRRALLRMRAGGIDLVASYVFWIHHEELAGAFDWSGPRNLRGFVETCRDVDVPLVLRLGPWCHGEVRNGGFPDWLLHANVALRSDDPAYLAHVDRWFHAVAREVDGLLWKDGGPIVGVQIENEFGGAGSHLVTIKRLAVAAGFDVPLYTRTGWPESSSPIPFGELLPLHGAYAEGFWDRTTASMPGRYPEAFRFGSGPSDVGIATDHFGDAAHAAERGYPFLTCELGGGMMSSYHRRIRVDPRDAAAIALVKLGSGSNLPGYYMYHGGTNPTGRATTLQEKQRTTLTNWNDLPERNYDFQAPIGQFGQVRESYRRLRRLHSFCRDFGARLTDLPVTVPADGGEGVRWSTRSDGQRGFLFVNHYERLRPMPALHGATFTLTLRGETLRIPAAPIDLPPDVGVVWPFNLPLADGLTLRHATAQPMCKLSDEDGDLFVFAKVGGVRADFAFDQPVADAAGRTARDFSNVGPERAIAFAARSAGGRTVRLILLSDEDSLSATTLRIAGRDVLALTSADLYVDGDVAHVRAGASTLPPVELIDAAGRRRSLRPTVTDAHAATDVPFTLVRAAGKARAIELSATGVALAPEPADFDAAAVYEVLLPREIPPDAMLTLRYVGDVMRVHLGDEMIVDDFYNGDALMVGLERYRNALDARRLRVEILPMPADAPIGFSSPVPFEPAAGVEPALRSAQIEGASHGWFSLSEEVFP